MTKHGLTPRQRFDTHVEINDTDPDACHLWTGAKDQSGYGHFNMNGTPVKAHRAAYDFNKGAIPEGLIVRHMCDNPACVNPNHLELGTHKENTQDMMQRGRGRWPKGREHYRNKFTDEDRVLIAQLVGKGWFTLEEIATRLGVAISTVHKISKSQ